MKAAIGRFCLGAILLFTSQALGAQEKSAKFDMSGMMKVGEMYYNPAAFVLAHKEDLALTDVQVKSIDSLEKNSDHPDFVQMSRPGADEEAMLLMLANASVPIDEAVVRRGVQARVDREVKLMVGRARADRLVQAVLTPFQKMGLQTLQMKSAMEMMGAMTPESKH